MEDHAALQHVTQRDYRISIFKGFQEMALSLLFLKVLKTKNFKDF